MPIPELTEEIESQIKEQFADEEPTTLSAFDISIIVKSPPRGEVKRFMQTVEKDRYGALEMFIKGCRLWPTSTELDGIFAKKPGLVLTYGNELIRLAGVQDSADAKKL